MKPPRHPGGDPDALIDARQLDEIELLCELIVLATASPQHLTGAEVDAAMKLGTEAGTEIDPAW